MRYVVFDIETSNTFDEVGERDPAKLDLSVLALYDSETDQYSSYYKEDLEKCWPIFEKADVIIGFNSDHFDIPLLSKYYQGTLSHIKSLDLMKEIQKSLGRRIGLDAIVSATLGAKKTADGLQAITWWREGKKELVRDYCINDVKVTHELYRFMKTNQLAKYHDGISVREIIIDTSDWDAKRDKAITMSLPF